MTKTEYQHYLNSEHWKKVAHAIRLARNWQCAVPDCRAVGYQVHHLNYQRCPYLELDADLQLLCRRHHCEKHGIDWHKEELELAERVKEIFNVAKT